MCVTANPFFTSIVILAGLFSFTFVFFPQTQCMDGPSAFRSGETHTGLMKNNILIPPLLMVVGFSEIFPKKKKKQQKKNIFSVVS